MALAPVFTFDAERHVYAIGGVAVPSVTQILRLAGLVDGYDGIPEHVLRYAADRSVAVHLACCYLDEDDLDPDTLDPLIAPYVAAWRNFRLAHPFKVVESEQIHLGQLEGLRFGMTLDRLVDMEGSPCEVILDIKCTREIHRHHGVQLAGYAFGVGAPPDCAKWTPADSIRYYRRAVVQLKPDATYKLHEFSDPQDGKVFAAALRIAHWKLR